MGRRRGGQGLWCNLRFWKDLRISFGKYQSGEDVGCFATGTVPEKKGESEGRVWFTWEGTLDS